MNEVWSAPVRYSECDQQGIVFNGHYLAYCDEAGSAWYSSRGTPYADLLARGLDMHVIASTLDWSSSARWGDVVSVDAGCERIGGSSFVVRMLVRVGGRHCCTVTVTNVLVDGSGRPVRVPDDLRAAWLDQPCRPEPRATAGQASSGSGSSVPRHAGRAAPPVRGPARS